MGTSGRWNVDSPDLSQLAAESAMARFVEQFKNYGMLLQTMTPQELACEIGRTFQDPKQAAIIVLLAQMVIGRSE